MAKVEYYTCFISYGEPNLEFARKLYQDLDTRGVSRWMYNKDSTVGAPSWKEIGQQRRGAEKMVAICSADALVRDGFLKEIEEQIDEDPEKLVPISLTDLWKQPGFRVVRGTKDLKPFLLEWNYADFLKLSYEEALERLLKGLSRKADTGDHNG